VGGYNEHRAASLDNPYEDVDGGDFSREVRLRISWEGVLRQALTGTLKGSARIEKEETDVLWTSGVKGGRGIAKKFGDDSSGLRMEHSYRGMGGKGRERGNICWI